MIKFKGSIYLVSIDGVEYAVKHGHLDEFVALMHTRGSIVVNDLVMSQIYFDDECQWYRKI